MRKHKNKSVKSWAALKKEYEARFPKYGKQIFDIYYNSIICSKHHGFKRDDEFGNGPRHANTTRTLLKNWGAKLSKSVLYSHFLGAENTVLYYTNNPNLILKSTGQRLAVAVIDIDNKQTEENKNRWKDDSELILERVKKHLPTAKMYATRSTSGTGIHATFCLLFSSNSDPSYIHDSFTYLSEQLRNLVNDGSTSATFDKICGSPHYLLAGGEDYTRGILAKIPSFSTDNEAGMLLEVLCHAVDYNSIISEIEAVKGIDKKENSKQEEEKKEEEEKKCDIQMVGDTSSQTLTESHSQILTEEIANLRTEADSFKRRRLFGCLFCNIHGKPLDAGTMLAEYERHGLASGSRERNLADFTRIAAYIGKHFDSSYGSSITSCLSRAKSILSERINQTEISEAYGKQKNGSTLTLDDVAFVYAVFIRDSKKGKREIVTLAARTVVSFSRTLKQKGVICRLIDFKRFAASKRILASLGLLEMKIKGKKGVTAEGYLVCDISARN